MSAYGQLPNKRVTAATGVEFAYRDTGDHGNEVPLVLLNHFRGNLDNWDPALVDALAATRRVITFDNAGVGGSSGVTPDTIGQMARDAIAFLAAMGFGIVDLLGRGLPQRCPVSGRTPSWMAIDRQSQRTSGPSATGVPEENSEP